MPSPTSTALGEGPGFRKVRRELGVTAFGVNAIEIPPGFETGRHFHDEQEELYFVHRGRMQIRLSDDTSTCSARGPRARGRRHRAADQERRRRAGPVPDRRRQGRLRGPRRPPARGRDEPLRLGAATPAELLGSASPSARPCSPAVRSSRPTTSGTCASTGCPCPALGRDRALDRRGEHMHADFGSGRYQGAPIGIPYVTVPRRQRRVRV